jgi:hypothetical protein
MKITCCFGEFDVFGWLHPETRKIEQAVSVQSLVDNLRLSLRKLPKEPGLLYVRTTEDFGIPFSSLNTFLFSVKTTADIRNRLLLELAQRSSHDVGFLTHAHLQLQDSLSALSAYYQETGMDAEYPVDEVEDVLGQIYCEFLQAGAYDPLNMTTDRQPMSDAEAWMLSMLETTTASLIREFIHEKNEPDIILVFLQVGLKERLISISQEVRELATGFLTPEDLQSLNDVRTGSF